MMQSAAIPSSWRQRRLRFDVKSNPKKAELDLDPETEVSFVPMDAVGEYGGLRLDTTRAVADVYKDYTYFTDGDVCIARITPCFENGKGALATGLTEGVAFGTTELHVLRPTGNVDRKFLFYITISHDFRGWGEAEMLGAGGQKRVPERFIKDWRAPLPDIDTQRRIAGYLDDKTARIDALIEKKRALLDRLAEKRQALITRAVTRGLNPAAPLKDSGIDWLGKVPVHWEMKKLKYLTPKVSVGIVVTPANWYAEEGILALRGLNIRPMGFDLQETRLISDEGHEFHAKSQLNEGDLVSVRTGDPGTTAVVTEEFDGCNCIDLVIIRRPVAMLPRYLGWFLNSDVAKVQYQLGSEGALQAHFNVETSKETLVAVPPVDEQSAIVDHLEAALEAHDETVSKIINSVEKLTEYRAALVTAAVTGKIKALLTVPAPAAIMEEA
jgi:type I restriction enzyme S subunit